VEVYVPLLHGRALGADVCLGGGWVGRGAGGEGGGVGVRTGVYSWGGVWIVVVLGGWVGCWKEGVVCLWNRMRGF
jgi:hypothetical protein